MNPTVKKLFLFATGAISLTKEKFDDFVQELEKEGALDKQEGEQLVKDFLTESDKRAREFKDAVEKEVRRVMSEMNKKEAQPQEEEDLDEQHKCPDCGEDCDCDGAENCNCEEDCNCENCK